jgi:hypothetical protein
MREDEEHKDGQLNALGGSCQPIQQAVDKGLVTVFQLTESGRNGVRPCFEMGAVAFDESATQL